MIIWLSDYRAKRSGHAAPQLDDDEHPVMSEDIGGLWRLIADLEPLWIMIGVAIAGHFLGPWLPDWMTPYIPAWAPPMIIDMALGVILAVIQIVIGSIILGLIYGMIIGVCMGIINLCTWISDYRAKRSGHAAPDLGDDKLPAPSSSAT